MSHCSQALDMWQPPSLAPESVFHALDVDGFGALTPAQVEAALDLYQLAPPCDSEWKQILDAAGDVDPQERTSQDAFCRFVESRLSKTSEEHCARALFSLLQPSDGDDRLTAQGLVAAAESAGVQDITLQEAADMITFFDDSGDGTIGVDGFKEVLLFET